MVGTLSKPGWCLAGSNCLQLWAVSQMCVRGWAGGQSLCVPPGSPPPGGSWDPQPLPGSDPLPTVESGLGGAGFLGELSSSWILNPWMVEAGRRHCPPRGWGHKASGPLEFWPYLLILGARHLPSAPTRAGATRSQAGNEGADLNSGREWLQGTWAVSQPGRALQFLVSPGRHVGLRGKKLRGGGGGGSFGSRQWPFCSYFVDEKIKAWRHLCLAQSDTAGR